MAGKQPVRYASCQKVQYAQNCRHIKMLVIGDFKASTITGKIKTGTDGNAM